MFEYIYERDIDIMAKTLWGEARGEGDDGMRAVAHVIKNRVHVAHKNGGHYWWGHSVESVCLKPWQFSCWNSNDSNRRKILNLTHDDHLYKKARAIAMDVLKNDADITHGADHYHHRIIFPRWAQGKTPVAVIGNHLFYQLEG